MKHVIFTIYDSKVESYSPPFYARSVGEGIRTVTTTLKNPDLNLSQYPDDFLLYHIGTFCDDSAIIELYDNKIFLGSLKSFTFSTEA